MSILKLKEVLWEFTLNCNKYPPCEYCGSKDIINKGNELPLDQKVRIAEHIGSMHPESVVITGGEPTIDMLELNTCAEILKSDFCIKNVGIVTNGYRHLDELVDSKFIDTIGVSINTREDVDNWNDDFGTGSQSKPFGPNGKITIVTNVGEHNIFDLEYIFEFVKSVNGFIQIQITQGKYQLNSNGIKHLYKLIKDNLFEAKNVGYILADNAQHEHECQAGITSCSVDFQGNVVSCLSKRAWCDWLRPYGSLLADREDTFRLIWRTEFENERFDGCESCRDQIDYPELTECEKIPDLKKRGDSFVEETTTDGPFKLPKNWGETSPFKPYDEMPQIVMYACIEPYETKNPMVFTYGVVKPYDLLLNYADDHSGNPTC